MGLRCSVSIKALIVSAMLVVPASSAWSQADSIIKGAVYDLDRIEQQLRSVNAKSAAKIKRLENSLDMTAERLATSTNQDDPSWQDANARVEAYRQHLQSLANPPASQQSQANAQERDHRGGQDPETSQATAAGQGDAAVKAVIDRFNRLVGHYNMDVPQLQKVTEVDLDDPDVRHKWQTKMAFYESEMAVFQPYLAEPNVKTMDDNVKGMVAHYRQMEERVLARLASFGDIDARIAEMQARYGYANQPQHLDAPYTADAIQAWANDMRALLRQAEIDKTWLTELLATTQTRAFDAQNLLNGSINTALPSAIEQAIVRTQYGLLEPVAGLDPFITELIDPGLPEGHAYRRNLEGDKYDNLMARLDDGLNRIETAILVAKATGTANDAATPQRLQTLQEARTRLVAMHNETIAGNRMPEAKSNDPELIRAAETVLTGDRYDYEWERLVINYAPKRKKETKAWWRDDVISVATYEWDEFQVATAEKSDDGYTVFYNEFHFYHSADPTVPTGRWILHNRFEGATILAENLD